MCLCRPSFAHPSPPRVYRGLALVELLVALALAAVLLRIALPAYDDFIASMRVMQEAQHIAASMNLARSEAIKRGVRVNLCTSANGLQCTSGSLWHGGWIMHVDADASGQLEAATDLIRARESFEIVMLNLRTRGRRAAR